MKHIGIHVWLILAAVILMSASTVAFFAGTNLLSTFVHKRFEERTAFLAKYLALNSELGILIGDRLMLKGLAENLLTQEDVIKVVITSKAGEELANVTLDTHNEKGRADRLRQVAAPVMIKGNKDESHPFFLRKSTPEEDTIGEVKIYYTVDGINNLLAVIKERFYLLSAGLVTISLFLFLLLSRFLVNPVRQLVSAAREVARGNLDLRVRPGNLPETRELAEAFNAMLDSLQKSNSALEKASQEMVRQKTLAEMGKFSLMIAHEVKNPLGIIKSSLDLLKQDMDLSSENIMVSYMEDEIQRLNRLIEDFLEFARPASPNCRETDMNMLIRECVTRFELQLKGVPASFQLTLPDDSCYLNIDPDLMTRVLSNIIKNALEITRGKGTINIVAETCDNAWRCRISDQGPGISPADLDKIFEPFHTTRAKGTGLGLAFASQVVGGHNGLITAGNLNSGGACFTITLPTTWQ
ncbi:MAG: HAMP domain-containing protein [Deltaproteobacteria bacterium]|nr:HAMP domain-containing protein [Deltaproteobacteria bacterium]